MIKYGLHVLFTAACLSGLIWYGLPILKDRAPQHYAKIATLYGTSGKATSSNPATTKPADVIARINRVVGGGNDQRGPSAGETPEVTNTPSGADVRPAPSGTTTNRSAATEKGHPHVQPTPETGSVTRTETTNDVGQPEDPLMALNKDPGYDWGLVVTNSFAYDAEMKRIGIIAGGTIVSRKRSELKLNGYVAECFYIKDRLWQYETLYLYEADLVMFKGTYEQADVEQRSLLVDYCRTLAEYETLRAEAHRAAIRRNPHFNAYRTAVDEYNEFVKKGQTLRSQAEQATGPQRTRLTDELRKLRAQEATQLQKFKDVQSRYEAWKQEHLGDDRNPRIGRTVEMQNLENKLNAMRPRVQEMVPGL